MSSSRSFISGIFTASLVTYENVCFVSLNHLDMSVETHRPLKLSFFAAVFTEDEKVFSALVTCLGPLFVFGFFVCSSPHANSNQYNNDIFELIQIRITFFNLRVDPLGRCTRLG